MSRIPKAQISGSRWPLITDIIRILTAITSRLLVASAAIFVIVSMFTLVGIQCGERVDNDCYQKVGGDGHVIWKKGSGCNFNTKVATGETSEEAWMNARLAGCTPPNKEGP